MMELNLTPWQKLLAEMVDIEVPVPVDEDDEGDDE